MPELLKLIEKETGVPSDSFLSEHLGHPDCNAMSLVFLINGKLESQTHPAFCKKFHG
jgi:hypothetical protein